MLQCPMIIIFHYNFIQIREICEVINAGTQPMQNSSVMNKHSDIQGERVAWSHFWIDKGLIVVEVLLFSTLKI